MFSTLNTRSADGQAATPSGIRKDLAIVEVICLLEGFGAL
jgi:hypothetical protein